MISPAANPTVLYTEMEESGEVPKTIADDSSALSSGVQSLPDDRAPRRQQVKIGKKIPREARCPRGASIDEPPPLPYHGAAPIHKVVREYLASIPDGAKIPMSARKMARDLETKYGLSPAMARRFFSQIRTTGALNKEWKEAYSRGKLKFSANCTKKRLLANSVPGELEELDHLKKTAPVCPRGQPSCTKEDYGINAPPTTFIRGTNGPSRLEEGAILQEDEPMARQITVPVGEVLDPVPILNLVASLRMHRF